LKDGALRAVLARDCKGKLASSHLMPTFGGGVGRLGCLFLIAFMCLRCLPLQAVEAE
jgi:hypothetical protein